MLKKTFLTLVAVFAICFCISAKAPKYVFYMIADGVGINAYEATNEFCRLTQNDSLDFMYFPVRTFVSNHMVREGLVTDSAAAGTALAIGYQTDRGYIGLDGNGKAYDSILKVAHDAGYATGCITSVAINHATPSAFYAHNLKRSNVVEIGKEFAECTFIDFAAGASCYTAKHSTEGLDKYFAKCRKNGWSVTNNPQKAASNTSGRTFLYYGDGHRSDLPYVIDAEEGDVNLTDFMRAAIANLSSRKGEGFFLMCEGGKCDYVAHANDIGSYMRENYNFALCVRQAYEFYLAHPEETLIIVTSDHETGGLMYGLSWKNERDISPAVYQTMSKQTMTGKIAELRKGGHVPSYEEVRAIIDAGFSFGDKIKLNEKNEEELRACYDKYFGDQVESLYESNDKVVDLASLIFARKVNVNFATNDHSASYVPVFAIGVGAETLFNCRANYDLPRQVSKIMKIDNNFIK